MENIQNASDDQLINEAESSMTAFLENFDTNDPLLLLLLEEFFKILKE